MSWYGRVNNSCHLPLLTVIFIFVLRKSLHSCQSSRWLSINTRPRLPSLLMNSQNIKYWIILFDIIIWWCNHCIKNASIAIIIYFIQNLQLSNSVVGAVMVLLVVEDHLSWIMQQQLQLHCLPIAGVLWSKVIGADAVGNSTFWQKWEGWTFNTSPSPPSSDERPNCLIFCHKDSIHQSTPVYTSLTRLMVDIIIWTGSSYRQTLYQILPQEYPLQSQSQYY